MVSGAFIFFIQALFVVVVLDGGELSRRAAA
jgi:hypothetical protein